MSTVYKSKSVVSDDMLMAIYTGKLETIAKTYQESNADFDWLMFEDYEAYQVINVAEDKLNDVWLQCRDGQAGKQDFEMALSAYYGACMRGIKISVGRLS